jgi:hypothetical protein
MVNVKSLLFLAFAASAIAAPIDSAESTEAGVAQVDTTPVEVSNSLFDTVSTSNYTQHRLNQKVSNI